MSPKSLRFLKKLLPHAIIWFISSLIYVLLEKGILGEANAYPATGNTYDFKASLVSVLSFGTILGTLLGILEERLFKNLLRKKPFGTKLVLKTSLYVFIVFVGLLISAFLLNSIVLDRPLMDPLVVESIANFIGNFVFLSVMIYVGFIIALSLFFSEMVDHIGINAITNFFTGKYSKSKVEDRIFMFLDMRSSTSIAEKLGHEKYYQLLNQYYDDMTQAIISSAGEIYQYVGDEIIVSWKLSPGLKDQNCIQCFFQIKERIQNGAEIYLDRFGVSPQFKAGIHCGKVSTGEIGVIKKEILFTGDVLNTTARIQGLCNELNVELLVSDNLKKRLGKTDKFIFNEKGEYKLRGKDHRMSTYEVVKAS